MLVEQIHILAVDDGSGQTTKIVVGVAAAALWLLAQVASSWSERRKKKEQQPQPPRAPRGQRPPPPDYNDLSGPIRTELPPRRQQQAPPPRQQQTTPRRQQKQRQRASSSPPPLQMPPRQAPVVFEEPAVTRAAIYKARDPDTATEGPTRRDRLKSILRPRNLKKEFILTEILQPPLAMRERPENV